MLKRAAKALRAAVAPSRQATANTPIDAPNYVLYPFLKEDGSFDYDRYRAVQQNGNKAKLNCVFAIEKNIRFFAEHLRRLIPAPQFGLCHGTRRGKEQEWFRKYLGCEVLGTEISDTATMFPHTIQWDFHEVKPEWIDAVDFIYSNSFDHTYDPEKCLNAWMSCLRPGGVCLLEHSSAHAADAAKELDPFGADIVIMPYLILKWSQGRCGVREILTPPARPHAVTHLHCIVCLKH